MNYAWSSDSGQANFGTDFGGFSVDVVRWWMFPQLYGEAILLDGTKTPTGVGGTLVRLWWVRPRPPVETTSGAERSERSAPAMPPAAAAPSAEAGSPPAHDVSPTPAMPEPAGIVSDSTSDEALLQAIRAAVRVDPARAEALARRARELYPNSPAADERDSLLVDALINHSTQAP